MQTPDQADNSYGMVPVTGSLPGGFKVLSPIKEDTVPVPVLLIVGNSADPVIVNVSSPDVCPVTCR